MALDPGGKHAALVVRDGTIQIFKLNGTDAPTLKRTANRVSLATVYAVAFDASGDLLRFISRDGWMKELKLSDDQSLPTALLTDVRRAFTITSDGLWAASLASNRDLELRSIDAAAEPYSLPPEDVEIWTCDWSPDGGKLAVGLTDGRVVLWNFEKLRIAMQALGMDFPSTKVRPR